MPILFARPIDRPVNEGMEWTSRGMLAKNRVGANLGTGRFLTFFRAKQQKLHFADVSILRFGPKIPIFGCKKTGNVPSVPRFP
jgi:hypothetical protein